MNNDSTPPDLPRNEADNDTNTNATTPGTTVEPSQPASSTTAQNVKTPAQKRVLARSKKRYDFITDLMTNLDILIYAELSIVYYMDCSIFRLLLRVVNQMMFLTPKPTFLPPAPQHRPYIGAIFGPNIICMLLHLFTARSEAGEAVRGYLHGGVLIDLIGQKGPTSKIHLLLLDLLILGLQCFMLSVHVERERLSKTIAALSSGLPVPPSDRPRAEVVAAQDHDAEEQGVLRDGVADNGIELQPLANRRNEQTTAARTEEVDHERNAERERLLAEPVPRIEGEGEDDDIGLDTFWSGTVVLADFHIVQNLKRQWQDYGIATESALQTVGYSAELAGLAATRRLTVAGARFQQQMGQMG